MKNNVGGIDRVIRILLGLVLIALTLSDQISAWGWLGVVPLVTGVLGWCPPYSILGINTCSLKKP